jgi:tetratricopeptide (TPR) repeat protein
MRSFDLRHELRGEGDRASPPADIPAEPDAPRGLAAARAQLRMARAALDRGDGEAAAEACGRARTLAPNLPEALELDAQVAQARGDLARAKKLYQLWLDGGADDPPGEERARSVLAR